MIKPNIEIRLLTQEDYKVSMELIHEFAKESLLQYGVSLDPKVLKLTFSNMYKTSFGLLLNGQLIGLLGGVLTHDSLSNQLIYLESIWFVTEKHRRYGISMLRYIEDYWQKEGIARIVMSCMHGAKVDKLFSFYEKSGYRPLETKFIKEL